MTDLPEVRLFGGQTPPAPGSMNPGDVWMPDLPEGEVTTGAVLAWAQTVVKPVTTDDDREALEFAVLSYDHAAGQDAGLIEAILAAGFRRQPPTPSPAPPTREALENAFSEDGPARTALIRMNPSMLADAVLALLNGGSK